MVWESPRVALDDAYIFFLVYFIVIVYMAQAAAQEALWPAAAPASMFASFLKKRVMSHHHAMGWVFKAVPSTVWKRLDETPNHPLARTGWVSLIQSWGHGRFAPEYLQEVVEGLPWAKSPTYLVGLTQADYNNAAHQYLAKPQSFVVYGTFQPVRSGALPDAIVQWKIRFDGAAANDGAVSGQTLNTWADAGNLNEIEVLISAPNARRGAGSAALDTAMTDIMAKKRQQSARFKAIVVFTDNADLKRFLLARGFNETGMSYHQKQGNAWVQRTSWLRQQRLVDGAQTKAYVFVNRFNGVASARSLVKTLLRDEAGRTLDAVCHVAPNGPVPNRLWPACR